MTTVNCYKVEISDGSGILGSENKFQKKILNVIGENKTNFVVDDEHFTTVRKLKCTYLTSLDEREISISNNDSCFGNRISYTLFTYTNKRAKTIRKEIEEEVERRFGFFTGRLDLSVIKD